MAKPLSLAGTCGAGLSELKEAIWRGHQEVMRRFGLPEDIVGAYTTSAVEARGSGRVGRDEEVPGKLPVLCREDMVHYLDVRGGWDLKECECCFDRALSLGEGRAVTMQSLSFVRSLLHKRLPNATPFAPRSNGINEGVLEFSAGVWKARGVGAASCTVLLQVCSRAVRLQEEHGTAASVLVQVLGVKESADLQEGFGFFVQHVLSGGLEKAHAEGRGGHGGKAKAQGGGGGGAGKVGLGNLGQMGLIGQMGQMLQTGQMGQVGRAMEVVGRAMEVVRRRVESGECMGPEDCGRIMAELGMDLGDLLGRRADGAGDLARGGGDSGKDGKGGQWREHLKGREWERYVDGMAWILEHGGGEGSEFKCSHCSDGGGSNSSASNVVEGSGIPKGMYVSGVGATDFALAVASVFSRPEHRKLGAMFFAASQSATSSNVQDAAIEDARGKLKKRGLGTGVSEGGARGGGLETATSAAPATYPKAAAASAKASSFHCSSSSVRSNALLDAGSGSTGSGTFNRGLVPVNTNPAVGLLTYRVARLLQWFRIYGSDFVSAKSCFKDSPQGKVLPMRHPLRDLPSLLVRFGAVLPSLDGSTDLQEWEEWPEGDEATVKFSEDASARCFGMGRAAKEVPSPRSETRPIIRCRADADLVVDFAGLFLDAPACAHCSCCIHSYISHVSFVTFIANFAYSPASILLDCFLFVFPPHSEVFQSLLARLRLENPCDSLSAKRSSSSRSVQALRERAEQVPVAFLLSVALLCATPLLQQIGMEGGWNPRAGGGSSGANQKAGGRRAGSGARGKGMEGGEGDGGCGVVWEEVQSWSMVATLPATSASMGGGGVACSASEAKERSASARMEALAEMYERSLLPRFREDLKHESGTFSACGDNSSSHGKQKGKQCGEQKGMAWGSQPCGMSARDAAGGAVLPPCLACLSNRWPPHLQLCPHAPLAAAPARFARHRACVLGPHFRRRACPVRPLPRLLVGPLADPPLAPPRLPVLPAAAPAC
ncbi:unnamed protein product [Closterium sp. Naga37s-1]|nr:unnamed protein product [Closterium sp. Naga37s-1]